MGLTDSNVKVTQVELSRTATGVQPLYRLSPALHPLAKVLGGSLPLAQQLGSLPVAPSGKGGQFLAL